MKRRRLTKEQHEFPERSRIPRAYDFQVDESTNEGAPNHNVGSVEGIATGDERPDTEIVAGGWQGTDDATSTAPSDLIGLDDDVTFESPEESALHVESYNGELTELSKRDADAIRHRR